MRNIIILLTSILLVSCIDKGYDESRLASEEWVKKNILQVYDKEENARVNNDYLEEEKSYVYKKIKYNEDTVTSLQFEYMRMKTYLESDRMEYKRKSIEYGASVEEVWYADKRSDRNVSFKQSTIDAFDKIEDRKPDYFYIQQIKIAFTDLYSNQNGEELFETDDVIYVVLDNKMNVLNSMIEPYTFDGLDDRVIRYKTIK